MRTNIVTLGLAATALVAAGGASQILILAVVAAAIFAGIEISGDDEPASP